MSLVLKISHALTQTSGFVIPVAVDPEDAGNTHLKNVSNYLPVNTSRINCEEDGELLNQMLNLNNVFISAAAKGKTA